MAFAGVIGASEERKTASLSRWILPLSSYESAKNALDKLSKSESSGLKITIQPLPDLVFRILRAAQTCTPDDSDRIKILKDVFPTDKDPPPVSLLSPPPKKCLYDRLMPFQQLGVEFGLRRGGRCIIADEMGLGKTIQSLCLLQCYRDEGPALIITPSSLRGAWSEALVTWLPNVTEKKDVQVIWKAKDISESTLPFVICSYDSLHALQRDLLKRQFSTIILDEAHYIKNSSTKRSTAALPLCRKAKRCILLSGTPMLNNGMELLSLLHAVLPLAQIRDREFCERYCEMDPTYPSKFVRAKQEQELYLLMKSVMIRRKKLEVLHDLPSKRRQRVDLKLDSKDLKSVRDCPPEARYHQTALAKVKAVREYLKDLLVGLESKILIFAHHKELLDGIEAECRASKTGFIRIDGSTDQRMRPQLVSEFQNNHDIKVAVLSIKASGQGLTLTAASLVLFAELSYTPGEIQQAEDRAHRIGQASSVLVQFLHAKGTADDSIWAAIQSKLDDVGTILDGKGDQMEVAKSQGSQGSAAFKRPLEQPASERKRPAGSQSGIQEFFKPKNVGVLSSIAEGDVEEPAAKKQRRIEVDLT